MHRNGAVTTCCENIVPQASANRIRIKQIRSAVDDHNRFQSRAIRTAEYGPQRCRAFRRPPKPRYKVTRRAQYRRANGPVSLPRPQRLVARRMRSWQTRDLTA